MEAQRTAFLSQCGFAPRNDTGVGCAAFAPAWAAFEALYRGGSASLAPARSLIVTHAHTGEGFGFMAGRAVDFVRLGMVARRAVFFDYHSSPYDWTPFFTPYNRRDLSWAWAPTWSRSCVVATEVSWRQLLGQSACIILRLRVIGSDGLGQPPLRDFLSARACRSCAMSSSGGGGSNVSATAAAHFQQHWVWQDREIRFDAPPNQLAPRKGEQIIDSINSVEDTKAYKENIADLAKNLSSLNTVYANMLNAMGK